VLSDFDATITIKYKEKDVKNNNSFRAMHAYMPPTVQRFCEELFAHYEKLCHDKPSWDESEKLVEEWWKSVFNEMIKEEVDDSVFTRAIPDQYAALREKFGELLKTAA